MNRAPTSPSTALPTNATAKTMSSATAAQPRKRSVAKAIIAAISTEARATTSTLVDPPATPLAWMRLVMLDSRITQTKIQRSAAVEIRSGIIGNREEGRFVVPAGIPVVPWYND